MKEQTPSLIGQNTMQKGTHIHIVNRFSTLVPRQFNREKTAFSTNGVRTIKSDVQLKERKINTGRQIQPILHITKKINWTMGLNIKLLEENLGQILFGLRGSQDN